MAHLDNHRMSRITAVGGVGAPGDNSSPSSLDFPSPSLNTSRSNSERRHSSASPSPSMHNRGHPSCPNPILRSAQNSLDAFGSSSRASDSSQHHPSPTHSGSIRWAANSMELRDRDEKTFPGHGHRRKRGHCFERDAKYNSPSSLHSAHSYVTSALPSPEPPTFTWKPLRTQSRPSAVTSFFRRTVRRVRRSSLSPTPGGETGSDPTRDDGQKREDQKQRSAVLDNLEERLNAANKLHGEAVTLHTFYESGTVANMRDLRAGKAISCCLQMQNIETSLSGLPRPLPQDNALFCEVDLVLTEVWRSYERLTNFWKEEKCHMAEALKKGCIDPRDFERWSNILPSLEQTIRFLKVSIFLY
jgi:hypothetical protein